jgi:hypothetical protein
MSALVLLLEEQRTLLQLTAGTGDGEPRAVRISAADSRDVHKQSPAVNSQIFAGAQLTGFRPWGILFMVRSRERAI